MFSHTDVTLARNIEKSLFLKTIL